MIQRCLCEMHVFLCMPVDVQFYAHPCICTLSCVQDDGVFLAFGILFFTESNCLVLEQRCVLFSLGVGSGQSLSSSVCAVGRSHQLKIQLLLNSLSKLFSTIEVLDFLLPGANNINVIIGSCKNMWTLFPGVEGSPQEHQI